MTHSYFIPIIHILISLLLTTLIFLQTNTDDESRNNILSTTNMEKRGWEKTAFYLTISVLAIFLLSSILQTFLT